MRFFSRASKSVIRVFDSIATHSFWSNRLVGRLFAIGCALSQQRLSSYLPFDYIYVNAHLYAYGLL